MKVISLLADFDGQHIQLDARRILLAKTQHKTNCDSHSRTNFRTRNVVILVKPSTEQSLQ